jgi:thioredoxin 1
MAAVKELTDDTFEEKVFRAGKLVLVDFTAPWCAPCRAMAPAIEDIAKEYENEADVYTLQADDNRESTTRYEIRIIPTFLLMRGEEILFRATGAVTRSALTAAIEQALGEPT